MFIARDDADDAFARRQPPLGDAAAKIPAADNQLGHGESSSPRGGSSPLLWDSRYAASMIWAASMSSRFLRRLLVNSAGKQEFLGLMTCESLVEEDDGHSGRFAEPLAESPGFPRLLAFPAVEMDGQAHDPEGDFLLGRQRSQTSARRVPACGGCSFPRGWRSVARGRRWPRRSARRRNRRRQSGRGVFGEAVPHIASSTVTILGIEAPPPFGRRLQACLQHPRITQPCHEE